MTDFEQNREWVNKLTVKIEEANEQEIFTYLEELENKWKIQKTDNFNLLFSQILTNFKINDLNDIDVETITMEKDKILWELTGVHSKFVKFYDNEFDNRWNNLYENFYYSEKLLRTYYILYRMSDESYEHSLNEDNDSLFKFTPIDTAKNTAYQNLLLFIFGQIKEHEYARYQDSLYTKIIINGKFTHAWKKVETIKNFIMKACNMRLNFEQWKNSTAGGNNNIKSAEQYLIDYVGPELQVLNKNRHVHSFRNGVFISKIVDENKNYSTIFIPHGEKSEHLDSNTVASKYFDQDFNNYDELEEDNWFEIIKDCPIFKSILDYQKFSKEVQKWLCIFIGKNLFEINEVDKWAVVCYLLGIAGSGKSTIIEKIIAKFYEEEDVKLLSNNIEKKFGLKPLTTAKIVIAPEIQADCSLEQTEWQLLTEGGTITPAEKNKNAETVRWKPPVTMAGNSVPAYKNNCGQTSRRTVIFKFWRKVIETDTFLEEKLQEEIGKIIKMCSTGYLNVNNKHKFKGIWKILPKYFHENQDEMDENTNTLLNFLKSSKVIVSDKVYIPEKVFKQAFNEHCRENSLPKTQFTADFYSGPFSNFNITVAKRSRKKYPINTDYFVHGTYFIGVDIVNDNTEEQDPELPD